MNIGSTYYEKKDGSGPPDESSALLHEYFCRNCGKTFKKLKATWNCNMCPHCKDRKANNKVYLWFEYVPLYIDSKGVLGLHPDFKIEQ
jgi:hypothetical protein